MNMMGEKLKKYNVAFSKEECLNGLEEGNITVAYVEENATVQWCNATWDSFLCWPAARTNTTTILPCPPLKGLFPYENITKFCDPNGQWENTDMKDCFDFTELGMPGEDSTTIVDIDPAAHSYGPVDQEGVIEFVGLSLSILDILIILLLLLCTVRRQWRLNQVRIGLLSALLIMCSVWLAIRIDKCLKESNYSYKGIIVVHRPVCETILGVLEWSKLYTASWLACVCFHGLLEVIKPGAAARCINLLIYALFTFIYSLIVVSVWIVLVKFAEDSGHQFFCENQYESRPIFHVVIWPCFVLICAATVLSFLHTVRAFMKVCSRHEFPNPNRRKLIQGIMHLIICLYTAAFWYFNYMAAWSNELFGSTTQPNSLTTHIASYFVYFLGAFIAVWIGASQCCLPAKEVCNG